MGMEMVTLTDATPSEVYYYQAFGLTIASTIPCPELLTQLGQPDVIIDYGAVPDTLEDAEVATGWYQQNSEAVLLKIDSIAKYLILQGKKIIIEPMAGSHADEVRLFLFGSAFGALLHQRGLLPVHGSAIEIHGSAVLFVGPSGQGKSTLAGGFHQLGYQIIADDVCVVSTANGDLTSVYPGFPRLKLWSDTLAKLGKNPEGLRKIIPSMEKRHLPLEQGFCATPRPLNRIYELTTSDTQEFNLIRLQGIEKLTPLMDHTYRPEFLFGAERKKLHFAQCAAAVRHATVCRVTRPHSPFLLADLIDLVKQDWVQDEKI
jgi:hypothetical protein